MMEGVQILNQFEVVTKEVFSWNSFWWGALIGAGVGVVLLLIAFIGDYESWDWRGGLIMCTVVLLLAALLTGWLGGAVLKPDPVEYETRYEVTIDPNVSMTEFMDKYEILETRGFIYTVREK